MVPRNSEMLLHGSGFRAAYRERLEVWVGLRSWGKEAMCIRSYLSLLSFNRHFSIHGNWSIWCFFRFSDMHKSIFSYNLSRPYPYPWFTWIVFIIGILATTLFSVINLAADGYELV